MSMLILVSLFLAAISTSSGQLLGIQGAIDGGTQRYNNEDYQVVLVRRPQAVVQPAIAVRQPVVAVRQPVAVVARPAPIARPQYLEENYGPPTPYSFGYNSAYDDGTTSSRQEQSDGTRVTGSYSYQDAQGLFRTVDYVADENGYRATIRTNEPGTANSSPADVELAAEETPASVIQQWLNPQARRIITRV